MAPEEAALQSLATSGSPIVGGNPPGLGGNSPGFGGNLPELGGNSPSSAFADGVNHDQDQQGASVGIKLRKVCQRLLNLILDSVCAEFCLVCMKTF